MDNEKEILNAKKWVGETTRSAVYGVCFIVAGAVGTVLAYKHDLPAVAPVCIGGIAWLVWLWMITESNYSNSREHLRKLQNPETKSE